MSDGQTVFGLDRGRLLAGVESFADRHIGPDADEVRQMLDALGFASLDALAAATIPAAILRGEALDLPAPRGEAAMIAEARALADANTRKRSFLGMGYHQTVTPPVIQRNILENPGWYTQYTPYQAEIAQGRLEALLNFQTMISDLTGLEIANASLLDEGTAAAEAMSMCWNIARGKRAQFLVDSACHPQTIAVLQTRAAPLGIEVVVQPSVEFSFTGDVFGALVQYPTTDGRVEDYATLCATAHANKSLVVVAADLLALALLRAPGEFGADVAVGSTQRFGVPMGYGGPHAAYFATHDAHKRRIPGRLVGVTRDRDGNRALRLALQTREQHIRRDRATSNICTSQVLLAIIASMYAAYHGPEGIRRIATRVRLLTEVFVEGVRAGGLHVCGDVRFDTACVCVSGEARDAVLARVAAAGMEVRALNDRCLTVTLDEATTPEELAALISAFTGDTTTTDDLAALAAGVELAYPEALARTSDYLTHPHFNSFHSEHELLRYLHRLQARDLSLTTSMIPLGSCTMKLNATAEMVPITMQGFADMHPFTDRANADGYRALTDELEAMLAEITGLHSVSLQPNAGSQGEYAGLLAIRSYHEASGEGHRNVCLIPSSAHGTNPASAVMSGMKVVVVKCDDLGNVDVADLQEKAAKHADNLSALMITYPSTHGVFEESILTICETIHARGGQVYMDGANMNAQVGLCRPGDFGVDVCHLNLHKTFCIPHGGGGPGVGPIAVAAHLAPHLPGHQLVEVEGASAGPVAAAPWGSAGILPISWMYIRMMGAEGLRKATQVAILNANYLAHRLKGRYDLLYTGKNGMVAHEFILDLRPLRDATGITVADVAKRLMDFGFHAPTMSWPVEGTLMVEPTESEALAELDRFADALLTIRDEIEAIERGEADAEDNALKNAPHTALHVTANEWSHSYSREQAAFPDAWSHHHKFWPAVARVDDAFGDRNLICSCPPVEDFARE